MSNALSHDDEIHKIEVENHLRRIKELHYIGREFADMWRKLFEENRQLAAKADYFLDDLCTVMFGFVKRVNEEIKEGL